MKLIPFNTNSAQRVYNDYIKRCRKALKSLKENDTEECLLEINSHIYEYLEAHKATDEMENLLNVIDRLGIPEETLKEYVASKKINQAIKSLNPKVLLHALLLNIRNGFIYIFLFVLFLLFACFPVLIILKIIYPHTVGCFVGKGAFYLGTSNDQSGYTEILGNGFIPAVILAAAIVYFIIIFILKLIKRKK